MHFNLRPCLGYAILLLTLLLVLPLTPLVSPKLREFSGFKHRFWSQSGYIQSLPQLPAGCVASQCLSFLIIGVMMILLQRVALRIKWVNTCKIFRTVIVMRSVLSKYSPLPVITSTFSLPSFNCELLCFLWGPANISHLLYCFLRAPLFQAGLALLSCCHIVHSAISLLAHWTCICFLIIVNTLTSNVKVKERRRRFVLCLKLFWVITHLNSMGNIFSHS